MFKFLVLLLAFSAAIALAYPGHYYDEPRRDVKVIVRKEQEPKRVYVDVRERQEPRKVLVDVRRSEEPKKVFVDVRKDSYPRDNVYYKFSQGYHP